MKLNPLLLPTGSHRALGAPITVRGRTIVPVENGVVLPAIPWTAATSKFRGWLGNQFDRPRVQTLPPLLGLESLSLVPTIGTDFLAVGRHDIREIVCGVPTETMFTIPGEVDAHGRLTSREIRYACAGPDGNLYLIVRDSKASQEHSLADIWRLTPKGITDKILSDVGILNALVFAAPAPRRGCVAMLCSVSNGAGSFQKGNIIGWKLDTLQFGQGRVEILEGPDDNLFGTTIGDDARDLAFDTQGRLLVAHPDCVRVWEFSGNRVPDMLAFAFALPKQSPNRIAFGGRSDRFLFVVTRLYLADSDDPTGRVFAVKLDCPGIPPYPVNLNLS